MVTETMLLVPSQRECLNIGYLTRSSVQLLEHISEKLRQISIVIEGKKGQGNRKCKPVQLKA